MSETPIENFDDPRWKGLISDFKERVELDKQDLGIKSDFLYNLEICPKPKYLLLGMEPGKPEPEKGAGTTCFFPIFLHYCAYKYLCGGEFKYYISDLAKGAMDTKEANENREKRYLKWLPLFEREWKLLGKPEIIVMSKGLYDMLDKNGYRRNLNIRDDNYILHYSPLAASHLDKEYDKYIQPQSHPHKFEEKELRDFADKLKQHLGPGCDVTSAYYELEIKRANTPYRKEKVFPLYSYDFEQVVNGKKIPH